MSVLQFLILPPEKKGKKMKRASSSIYRLISLILLSCLIPRLFFRTINAKDLFSFPLFFSFFGGFILNFLQTKKRRENWVSRQVEKISPPVRPLQQVAKKDKANSSLPPLPFPPKSVESKRRSFGFHPPVDCSSQCPAADI